VFDILGIGGGVDLKLSDFGFTDGINEIIGITFGEKINTAPLGVIVEDPNSIYAKVKLYPSHTRENLIRNPILWVNVTVDPIVFTISSFDDLDEYWFESLNPPVIKNSLAWCKFDVDFKDDHVDLKLLDGGVLKREFRTVNRGFNALIEALVHATRYLSFDDTEFLKRVEYYCEIVEKCGGEREKEAVKILRRYLNFPK
jgi:hypothetical protein